jgi:hypothetical protein
MRKPKRPQENKDVWPPPKVRYTELYGFMKICTYNPDTQALEAPWILKSFEVPVSTGI